jgi:hypothetical protein
MDSILILFSVAFVAILGSPFVLYLRHKGNQGAGKVSREEEYLSKRLSLLETLRELKLDLDTGKFSQEEFELMANPISNQLRDIDLELDKLKSE